MVVEMAAAAAAVSVFIMVPQIKPAGLDGSLSHTHTHTHGIRTRQSEDRISRMD